MHFQSNVFYSYVHMVTLYREDIITGRLIYIEISEELYI